jgi:RNA polymerase sigma-70 factor (ECF subfamily)
LDEADERAAIRAVKGGRAEAYALLVDAYKDRLHGLAWKMLRDRHEAEDIAQEAFLRAYGAIARFDETQPFANWLLRITTNLCLNRMRKKRPAPMAIEPDAEPAGVRASAEPAPDQLGYHQLRDGLEKELAGLPENQRAAFVLFHQQEMPYAEISAALGRPVGTIKSDIHRARQALMAGLKRRAVIE